MSRLGQGSDTTACPWCEGNIDPSGGYFSKLDDNHKSHNSQGFTIFSQFSRSPGRLLNHEWARMGTKVGSREKKGEGSAWMARLGAPARRFRRASIEKERTTNGHEYLWPGGYYPRSHVGSPQLWTGCNAPVSSQFAHLPCGESRDGVGILVVDGVSAARCERSPR